MNRTITLAEFEHNIAIARMRLIAEACHEDDIRLSLNFAITTIDPNAELQLNGIAVLQIDTNDVCEGAMPEDLTQTWDPEVPEPPDEDEKLDEWQLERLNALLKPAPDEFWFIFEREMMQRGWLGSGPCAEVAKRTYDTLVSITLGNCKITPFLEYRFVCEHVTLEEIEIEESEKIWHQLAKADILADSVEDDNSDEEVELDIDVVGIADYHQLDWQEI